MAMLLSARSFALGNVILRQQQHRRAVQPCHASAAAAQHTHSAGAQHSKYAILRLGGVRQMLQEGLLYTCPKRCLVQQQQHHQLSTSGSAATEQAQQRPEAASSNAINNSSQRSYVLRNVLGLRNGEDFTWGTPYIPNTLVEVEVVEEFEGPRPASHTASVADADEDDSTTMAIYRVKHIINSS